ncbi:hypothetical protein LIER_22678 [Lithospermum erythrorhizon]|uniref:Uncharacterized protein n=1 Tax=Lithospermum erythrorhizon TaxID=34254 RepID=A0AAV3QXS4_LITER
MSYKIAKEICDLLETAHVGTNQVNQTKIRLLTKEYHKFEIKEGESIADMHQRFNVIFNNLQSLGNEFSREEINEKIFETLTDDYDGKICAVAEAKDIGTIPVQELISSLEAEEELIAYKKVRRKNKKSLALVAAKVDKLIEMNTMKTTWDDDVTEEGSYSEVEKIDNNVCLWQMTPWRISELENDINVLKVEVDLKKDVALEKVELKQLLEKAKKQNASKFTKELIKKFDIADAKVISTPMATRQSSTRMSKTSGHGSEDDRDLGEVPFAVDVEQIHEGIGSSIGTWSGHGLSPDQMWFFGLHLRRFQEFRRDLVRIWTNSLSK